MHTKMGLVVVCGLAMGLGQVRAWGDDAQPGAGVSVWAQADQDPMLTFNGQPFHRAQGPVFDMRQARVPNSDAWLISWRERTAQGDRSYSAVSLAGRRIDRVSATEHTLRLRYAEFDPSLVVPAVPAHLRAPAGHDTFIVQFIGQPVEAADRALEAAGATIVRALHEHARLVRMDAAARLAVEGMDIVRWVGEFHPAYKLEEEVLQPIMLGDMPEAPVRYSVELFADGPAEMGRVEALIGQMGGVVEHRVPETGRLEATLTPARLLALLRDPGVHFIDRWHAPENDMSIARAIGGANFIEAAEGFTGQGVRGEVMDAGILRTHQEFTTTPPIMHTSSGVDSHGTSTYSIVFARGASSGARGMLPDGVGIFGSYLSAGNRWTHTRDLVLPTGPYRAVFQSNSWGGGLTTAYTTVSSEFDRIIFDHRILIAQSQSNDGTTLSRPEAWAKNAVSVGGIVHQNTLSKSDDCWCGGASIGPAFDGRIKPDLTHFFDRVTAATSSSATAYTQFSGTSAATPIVAGHFGLLFQMWSQGVFGNPTSGGDVFDERPAFTTAKALMINSAEPYAFSGSSTTQDKARIKQGWGLPSLQPLYENRESTFIVNEADVLLELDSATYPLIVPAGTPQLRATLVWADPQGTTSATIHRINNLDLKVTAPDGTIYWGNNGLSAGVWSTSGGVANTKDTVENVFIQNPQAGTWTVEVVAADINLDGHRATTARDSAFALVVRGVDGLAAAFDLPFEDQFPTLTLDAEKWPEKTGSVAPTTLGLNPPSEPNSLLLFNGATISSARVDAPASLLPATPLEVVFHTQHRSVEAGKVLLAEYYSNFFGEWRPLLEVASDGIDQTAFTRHAALAPLDAYGPAFRVRFSIPGSDLTDQWYIDDVLLQGKPALPDCRADLDGDGELTLFDFLAFQNAFASGDLLADFDDDGSLTLFDFLEFQNQFAAGC